MKKNRRHSNDHTRVLPASGLGEPVVKGRPNWRKKNQLKKLKIMMMAVLTVLILSAAAGAVLLWIEFDRNGWPEFPDMAGSSSEQFPSESEPPTSQQEDIFEEDDSDFSLLLVNKDHPIEDNFTVETEEFDGVEVDGRIVPYLEEMYRDAQQNGLALKAMRGYESNEIQKQKIQQEAQRLQQEKGLTLLRAQDLAREAFEKSEEPEFRTGLAVEFTAQSLSEGESFESSQEYQWLAAHCVEYGFIQRYPKNKEDETSVSFSPGHFRYVGSENAVKMRELDMCLEEYVRYMQVQTQG